MQFLSPSRRPRRSHEWTAAKAVTFIVTLAASQSVTLAVRRAGLSRKSAYALRARDPRFAAAWKAAVHARSAIGKREEQRPSPVPPIAPVQGDMPARAGPSSKSTSECGTIRRSDAAARDLFFARLAARHGVAAAPPVDK
jgi:hypothetical protein